MNFVDDQFPPIPRSIGTITSLTNHSLEWLRISQISPSQQSDRYLQWSVYSSPRPNDIQQGALGDCWLMAALALITERPQMLEHILLTKTVNPEGVYLVRICHNGLWKTVIVDDYFPCTGYNQLAFTQANRRQLYVPLIEKACAKLFGSYADLISGQTEEGLQLLTGAPCDHIDLNPTRFTVDSDLIWAKLLSACESQ
jgi:calpain-15